MCFFLLEGVLSDEGGRSRRPLEFVVIVKYGGIVAEATGRFSCEIARKIE